MKWTRLKRILVSAFVSLVIFFVISEISLQVYTRYVTYYDVEMARYASEVKIPSENPKIGHLHRSGVEKRLMNVAVRINSDGLRDREYDVPGGESYRIAALGDSITFGWGVEQDETFESILETELNRVRPTEIVNFGTGNYNTEQQVNLFFEKGVKYRPDRIVVFYFINDAEPTPQRSKWAYLSRVRTLTFYWSRVRALLSRINPSRAYENFYAELYGESEQGWVRARQAFVELRELCEEHTIGLQVFLLPDLHETRDYPFRGEHRKVMEFLEREGIDAVDLAPFFADQDDPRSLWVAPDDAHPNARGHELIARYVYPFLAEEIAVRD